MSRPQGDLSSSPSACNPSQVEPPPYEAVASEGWQEEANNPPGVRSCTPEREQRRSTTLPPPYDHDPPPSYEEALSISMARTSAAPTQFPIIQTLRAADSSLMLLPPSTALQIERTVQEEDEEERREAEEAQRRRRQIQLEEDRELDERLEAERLRRNLQAARYCPCAKCQQLCYSYYYSDPVSEATPIPIETQVLMQEVLSEGLAFCSVM